ncbi:hypothetical protein [Zhouia amylolytica]|uniref:Nitrogen regulatory protein P-II n=1 Tax=Zhouia amylolytica AD3 TaxID=1286632 RepID=W2UPE5_9FLAO|nr:hypothetical protein [Zhouia amylolytica]ETN95346.1 hypothetical protein P278_10680 [Zhouia amylolytica AD3]
MKLLLVTAVEEFQKDILKLFSEAEIESFSGSGIDGYKEPASVMLTSSWFPAEKEAVESIMFFSFTDDEKIDKAFELIKTFNAQIDTNNPVKAVVVPIEKWI